MSYHPVAIPYCGFILVWEANQIHLPLEAVAAQIHIADVSARVTLTQVFSNTSTRSDVSAQYVFPIPARAAVCAFEMKTQDGRVVHGVAKEKSQAKKEYDTAVSQGKWAGLVTEVSKDVFSISVGAIPVNQEISVNITYVIDLSDDELLDQVRFQLPTYIGARYGSAPSSVHSLSSSSRAKLSITADIEMTSPISKVSCPSHSVELSLGPRIPLPQGDERPFAHFGSVSLTSQDSFLDKYFVLSIQAAKLDYPRCIAETLPNAQTTALSLTLVPRFELPPIPSQEYVFVIDRSGSMAGSKMESAKRALIVLLKSLPSSGTSFNIVSFGTSCRSMWQKSKHYAQETLDDAIKNVDGMKADMGGTEIGVALQTVFDNRNKSVPAAVFLLTDGEVWNVDALFAQVNTAVTSSSKESFIRIFTLGIGNGASTALCEGLARAGNGACLMAIQTESIAGKCARLLKGSRTPPITNLRVDWGIEETQRSANTEENEKEINDDFEMVDEITLPTSSTSSKGKGKEKEPVTISMFEDSVDPLSTSISDTGAKPTPAVILAPHPRIQQAPVTIPSLLPGTRLIVSALIASKVNSTPTIPTSVTIHGDLSSGQKLAVKVPVQQSAYPATPPLIHTLAARRLIQDLEDGKVKPVAINANEVSEEDVSKAAIVRFSTEYQLTSKFASFIAVDESQNKEIPNEELPEILDEGSLSFADGAVGGRKRRGTPGGRGRGDGAFLGYSFKRYSLSTNETTDKERDRDRDRERDGDRGATRDRAMFKYSAVSSLVLQPQQSQLASATLPMGNVDTSRPGHSRQSELESSPKKSRKASAAFDPLDTHIGFMPSPPVQQTQQMQQMQQQQQQEQMVQQQMVQQQMQQQHQQQHQQQQHHYHYQQQQGPGASVAQGSRRRSAPAGTSDDAITALARVQSFNGGFTLDSRLANLLFGSPNTTYILQNSIPESVKRIEEGKAEGIWATVVACAYLEVKLASEKEVWEGIWEKAKSFVEESFMLYGLSATFEELNKEARKLF